jgi:hypothetical protein
LFGTRGTKISLEKEILPHSLARGIFADFFLAQGILQMFGAGNI